MQSVSPFFSPRSAEASRRVSLYTAVVVAVLGFAVVLGWCWNIPALKHVAPGLANMAFNAAVAFVAAGLALWMMCARVSDNHLGLQVAARLLSVLVLAIGGITLAEYLTGHDFGIDQLLVADEQQAYAYPGRPSPLTACCFTLAGMALLLRSRHARYAQWLTLGQMFLASLAVGGHFFGVTSLVGPTGIMPLAVHAAVGLWLLSFALLLASPGVGTMRLLISDCAGGVMLRRLLVLPLVFLVIGRLLLSGTRLGLYDREFCFALMVIAGAVVSLIATSVVARTLSRVDHARAEVMRRLQLQLQEAKLAAAIVEHSADAIISFEPEGAVLSWNPAAQRVFGYSSQEMIGQPISKLFPEGQLDREHRLIQQVMLANRVIHTETQRRGKDGTLREMSVTLSPICDAEDRVVGISKIARDITEQKRSETMLRWGELLQHLPWGVAVCSINSATELINSTLVTLHKLRSSDPIALVDLVHESSRTILLQMFRTTADTHHATAEVIGLRQDGSTFPALVEMTLLHAAGAKQEAIVVCLQDITERKCAEEEIAAQQALLKASEEKFRSSMEAASIGMALIQPEGHWLLVNPALCELLGYSERELLTGNIQSITYPEDLAADQAYLEQILAGKLTRYQTEMRFLHSSGRTIRARVGVSLVRDHAGAPDYLVAHIEDVTAQREAERVKDQFISMVSHELRTPLTSIRGALGLVCGAMSSELSSKPKLLLTTALENSERLTRLINDILDIDRIAAGHMQFNLQPRNLAQLTRRALSAIDAYAQKLGVCIDAQVINDSLEVCVDEDRFIQVLFNLLSNAAKFSSPGGVIVVDAHPRGSSVRLSVQDFGDGIPAEFRSRIFQRFSQADSSATRKAGGAGLGLHITRQIVERMGGCIDFDSEVGRGTTFWVEFPLVEHKGAAAVAVS